MKKIFFLVLIMILITSIIGTSYTVWGESFGLYGDLMSEFKQASQSSYEKLFAELSEMTHDYVINHKLSLQVAGFKSAESTGLSPDVVGDDIEEFADAFCEHGYANKSAQNYVCLIYVASTNEFTYREYLKDDSGVEIDWMKVEKAFCNDDDIATKYRNVCSIITTGEEISRGDFKGTNVLLIAIISGGIVIAAGIIVYIFVRRKKTS